MSFPIFKNLQLTSLPCVLENIIGIKVKSFSWLNNPQTLFNNIIWISCEELVLHSVNQSGYLSRNPSSPSPDLNQIINRRGLIASYTVAPFASESPNSPIVNFDQPCIMFPKAIDLTRLTFRIEGDKDGLLPINQTHDLMLTLELYYCPKINPY